MKKALSLAFLAVAAGIIFFLPARTKAAFSVELTNALPNDLTDVSSTIPSKAPEGIEQTLKGYQYTNPVGTDYALEFSVSNTDGTLIERSPFLVAVGTKIASYTFDATTQKITLVVKTQEFYPPEQTRPVPIMVFAFVLTTDSLTPREPGPPHAMAGGYVATTVLDWRILPPENREPGMGIELSGTKGSSGYFNMFVPATMFDFMSEMTGKKSTIKNLAVFVDDEQASVSVTELNGGGFIDVNITFTSGNTSTAKALGAAKKITKKVMAKNKLALSLAAKKGKVKNGKNAKLYGWLKSGKRGQEITIMRKKKGESGFQEVTKVKTKKRGYFSYKTQGKETGTFYYKVKYKNKKSPTTAIKVY